VSRRALILVLLAACAAGPLASRASAADLWVGGGRAGCSDALPASAVTTPAVTWCTLGQAARSAAPGDTVNVLAADYRETVRFYTSGTPAAPIRFVAAEPGVVVDAAGAGQALKLMDVSDVEISGLRVTGASAQGIWVQGGTRVRLVDLYIASNPGAGLTVKGTVGLSLEATSVTGNGSAGVLELVGTRDARYAGNEIRGNGVGGATYNGDGIQLGGTGADVLGNTIAANGSSTFEHGIYTGAASAGWTIELNTFADNAGANLKATGGPGLIRRNRMTNGTFGLILSDNAAPITAEHNVISGRAQHLVLLTTGSMPARGRLWANTVVQYGRSTSSGDASAVFVIAATSLELRDNLLCYAGADSLGVGLWVNDPTRLASLVSDTNWICARDAQSRHLAWAGHRTNLAGWRASSGQDARSLSSWAPQLDAEQRVTSTNWGRGRGDDLGLLEDFAGAPLPSGTRVDIGAFQVA
jgi:parallel beta helix pectate lyase-like protein